MVHSVGTEAQITYNKRNTVFPRIIAGGDYSRVAIISTTCIAHWRSCTKYSNKLNIGFLSVPVCFLGFNFNILGVRD